MNQIDHLQNVIAGLKKQLREHSLYNNLQSIDDVRLFMEYHVYAVWDFMSLIKHLQIKLTCTDVPWLPSPYPTLARFVNEIVHAEESDINKNGDAMSHFEMYLEAMNEVGADTSSIQSFIQDVRTGCTVNSALKSQNLDISIRNFVNFTFEIIEQDKAHLTAASFTFGREDLIPDMFIEIINQSNTSGKDYDSLRYYLERHIELDGDEHGPLALQLVSKLCGKDEDKWIEATAVSIASLKHRIALWDAINEAIIKKNKNELSPAY